MHVDWNHDRGQVIILDSSDKIIVIVLSFALTGCGTITTRKGLISTQPPYRCSGGQQIRYTINNYDRIPLDEALSNTGIMIRDYTRDFSTNQLSITTITKEHNSSYDFIESLPFILNGLSFGLIPARSYVHFKTEITVTYEKRKARYIYTDEISRWTSIWHHLGGGRSFFDYQAIYEETDRVLEAIRVDAANAFVHDMIKDGLIPPCK